ncbi:MAG: dTMP kinase [Candidatus Latescibacteria bacterium]|nr:dTMP kinase [Candidatus Latescibacterota bacterium]
MHKGLFIVFEGIDGSGTTTQCQVLTEKLATLGHPVAQTREPGGTPLAEAIRALVLDPKSTGIADLTELLLYAASRAQHVSEKIRPALMQGAHVICDRFTASTWAYQGYGRGLDLALIAQVTKIAEDGCEPDLTVYLQVPLALARTRRAKRGQVPDRLELAGDDFQARVANGYQELAKLNPDKAMAVDGSRNPNEVATEIWNGLRERWPEFPSPTPKAPTKNQGTR